MKKFLKLVVKVAKKFYAVLEEYGSGAGYAMRR